VKRCLTLCCGASVERTNELTNLQVIRLPKRSAEDEKVRTAEADARRAADYALRRAGLVSVGILHGDRLGARHVGHQSDIRRCLAHEFGSALALSNT
jgi:hypothetical protein